MKKHVAICKIRTCSLPVKHLAAMDDKVNGPGFNRKYTIVALVLKRVTSNIT